MPTSPTELLTAFTVLLLATPGQYINFHYHDWLLGGALHIDTLFHSAIAAMYKHHGIASVGLDGLVPIRYHVLSHQVMAGLSSLSGLEVLASYAYLFTALGPPLLAFAMALTAHGINPAMPFTRALSGVALALLAIVALPVFGLAAFWPSFYLSESYLVALVLLLLAVGLLHRIDCGQQRSRMDLPALGLLVLASGLAKGSVGIAGIGMLGFLGLTRYHQRQYWLMLVVTGGLFLFLMLNTAGKASGMMPFEPFHFIITFVYPTNTGLGAGKVLLFAAVHFLPLWWCLAGGLLKEGRTWLRSLECQVLAGLLLASLPLALSLAISGGSAYYFSSIAPLVALPFIVARHLPGWQRLSGFQLAALALLLYSLAWYTNESFVARTFRHFSYAEANDSIVPAIQALQAARDQTPRSSTLLDITNRHELARHVGCSAYWLYPAVSERPMKSGQPDPQQCGYLGNHYGLADYRLPYPWPAGWGLVTVDLPIPTVGQPRQEQPR